MKGARLALVLTIAALTASIDSNARGFSAVLNGPADQTQAILQNPSYWTASYGKPGGVTHTESLPIHDRLSTVLSRLSRPAEKLSVPKSMVKRCSDVEFHRLMRQYADHFQVSYNLAYAIAYQESLCNPNAVSKSGAIGLMQLMPLLGAAEAFSAITGKDIKDYRYVHESLHDPELNILLGVAYLRYLDDMFSSIPSGEPRYRAVLAAYNSGPTRVSKSVPWSLLRDDAVAAMRAWSEKIPIDETRDYVARVIYYKSYLDRHAPRG